MSVPIVGLGRWGIVLGLSACLVGAAEVNSADEGSGRVILTAQKTQKKKTTARKAAGAIPKEAMEADAAPKGTAPAPAAEPAGGMLSFKTDIAPILVANCMGCHSGTGRGLRKGKLNMSTFEKLMSGGKRGKDIVGGDPEASMLVLMLKGEEKPQMPPRNGQMGFADEAVGKIESWIKQGARLDAGISPTDPLSKYAATLDDLRRSELAKLSPEDRDKVAEQAGRDRWKKATKIEPELSTTKTGHFLLLSNLPKDRATKLLQAMEAQYAQVNKLLVTCQAKPLNPVEKIGLYVFKDRVPFVEFVRTNENQEIEAGVDALARLTGESPYLVAVDPAGGGEEAAPVAVRKGSSRRKKAAEVTGGAERTLAAVLTEQLFVAAMEKAGKPPRWVTLGLGAFMASRLDSRTSPYYHRLRQETTENVRIGWQAKANEVLGGEAKTETTRAVGFSLIEWMAANSNMTTVANFVHVMFQGQGKLDDAIGGCLNLSREEFFERSGLWLAEHYR